MLLILMGDFLINGKQNFQGGSIISFIKTNASPIYENREAQNSRYRYTYNTFSPLNEKEFVITCNYKFDTKWTQDMQDAGDGAALLGYGLTLTGVGAEIGVPLAGIGEVVSSVGSLSEILLDFAMVIMVIQ